MEEYYSVGYSYTINKEVYDFLCEVKKKIVNSREKELNALQNIINSDNCEAHHIKTFNYLISIRCKIGIIEYCTENKRQEYFTVQYSLPIYKQHLENESKERFEEIIEHDNECFRSDLIGLGFTGDVSDIL